MKPLAIFLILAILFCSCDNDSSWHESECVDLEEMDDCQTDPALTNIRLINLSCFNLCDLDLRPLSESLNYGNLSPGDTSCYQFFDSAYRYPSRFSGRWDTTNFMFNAIDFLGEELVEPGFYDAYISVGEGRRWYSSCQFYPANKNDFYVPNILNCSEDDTDACGAIDGEVNIRIRNTSSFDFCNVQTFPADGEQRSFGIIESGELSCYVPCGKARKNLTHRILFDGIQMRTLRSAAVGFHEPGNYTVDLYISSPTESGLWSQIRMDE